MVTVNDNIPGVVANGSTGNGSPSITINGTANIQTLGDDSLGVGANESGIVTINNANIISSGTNGVGIGTRDNDGIINIASGQINAKLHAIQMFDGNNQQINLSNINLIAEDDVILIDGSTSANLQITNGMASAVTGQQLLNVNNTSDFTGIFSQSVLNGDVFVEGGSTSTLSLLSNTLLTGSMDGGSALIDPTSRWLMTADSTILNMENNGVIDFGNYSGTYKQLQINSNYTTNNGTINLNTSLGADNSSTDIVVVQGNTTGAGFVKVTNTDGIGAPTNEGIKIIDVNGASNATFQLIGDYVFEGDPAVVSGAYAYRLYKNGISTPTDGDWYLRSSLKDSPTPLYQPGVPIYEAYANVLQLFNLMDTLQQRVGNRSWWGSNKFSSLKTSNLIEGDGFWSKIDGMQGSFEPKFSIAPFDYRANLLKYTLGIDKRLFADSTGSLVGGLAGHYGKVFSDINSYFGKGKINANGYGPTATLTWYGNNGFYVDGQAHAIWYDSDLFSNTSNQTLKNNNDAQSYATSLEIGKRILFNTNWSFTPQTQFGYYQVDFNHFKDVFGADVSLNNAKSLIGRLGLSVDYQNRELNSLGIVDRSHLYGIANLYYDFLNQYAITVSETPFSSQNYPLWGGLGIGGSKNWNNDCFSVFGEASVNTSLSHVNNNNYIILGRLGVRIKWD
ncbi:MAG: autotransporter outer membrane beta-barrel domain-containing protein [Candidatus Rickettsiella isopodorum]